MKTFLRYVPYILRTTPGSVSVLLMPHPAQSAADVEVLVLKYQMLSLLVSLSEI